MAAKSPPWKTFKHDGRKWKAKLTYGHRNFNPGELLGQCDHNKRTITVSAWQTHDEIHETLLHEILHAVWPNGIVSDATEEKLISKISPKLYEILEQITVVPKPEDE